VGPETDDLGRSCCAGLDLVAQQREQAHCLEKIKLGRDRKQRFV